jgi:hypothetical protein
MTNRSHRNKEMMRKLVAKYPDGYEDWASEHLDNY